MVGFVAFWIAEAYFFKENSNNIIAVAALESLLYIERYVGT